MVEHYYIKNFIINFKRAHVHFAVGTQSHSQQEKFELGTSYYHIILRKIKPFTSDERGIIIGVWLFEHFE